MLSKLLCSFFFYFTFLSSVNAQLIPWKTGVHLAWAEFTGAADNSSTFTAYTNYHLAYSSHSKGEETSIDVSCSFEQDKSWKKPERNLTDKLLQHEQLHFDIAELFARKMRKSFADYVATHKRREIKAGDMHDIFKNTLADCKAYNELYDKETNHSIIEEKQLEWTKKIVVQLQELNAYASK